MVLDLLFLSKPLFAVVLMLIIADVYTTNKTLKTGKAIEFNPVTKFLMDKLGRELALFGHHGLAAAYLIWVRPYDLGWIFEVGETIVASPSKSIVLLFVIYGATFAWNLAQMRKIRD